MDRRSSPRQLRAIISTQTEIAASDLKPRAIMQLIAERAMELTGAAAGLIEMAEGDELVYAVTVGEATPYLGTRLSVYSSLSGLCVREGRVLRSDDTSQDSRVDAATTRQVNAGSMICVPLVHREETVGVLRVYAPEPHSFEDADVETLELLSELIAAHIAHANLYDVESHVSRHDALTALPNRLAFEERLPIEVARASRSGDPLALCLLDLDGFKAVNDRLGHPAGDEALRSVARILDESRASDDCFRIGGDEFAVLMPETAKPAAEGAGERIAERVRAARIADGAITTSFGVSAGTDLDGGALFSAADQALLAAKSKSPRRNS